MKSLYSFLIFFVLFFSLPAYCADDEPTPGQMAPDFSIDLLDGSHFNLADYRGKKSVYLIFWNTWCSYCMKKIPKLKQLQTEQADAIQIIAVNTGLKDSEQKSRHFQQQFSINYPLAFDHNKQVTDLYGVWGTPTEFIIDINGKVRHRDHIPDDLLAHLPDWNRMAESQAVAAAQTQCHAQSQC